MNNNAKAWVKALRSGQYKQGVGRLRGEDDTFCCLGVACDLYCREVENIYDPSSMEYDGYPRSLPNVVRVWLGLYSGLGSYSIGIDEDAYGSTDNSLALLNDHAVAFNEIADIIESEPEGLFAS